MKYILFPDMSGYSTDCDAVSDVNEIFFELDTLPEGIIYIGDIAAIIRDGVACIEKKKLDVGTHKVSVYRKNSKSCWSCTPIVYDGERIHCANEYSAEDIIAIKRLIFADRDKDREMSRRMSALEEKILGYKLF